MDHKKRIMLFLVIGFIFILLGLIFFNLVYFLWFFEENTIIISLIYLFCTLICLITGMIVFLRGFKYLEKFDVDDKTKRGFILSLALIFIIVLCNMTILFLLDLFLLSRISKIFNYIPLFIVLLCGIIGLFYEAKKYKRIKSEEI